MIEVGSKIASFVLSEMEASRTIIAPTEDAERGEKAVQRFGQEMALAEEIYSPVEAKKALLLGSANSIMSGHLESSFLNSTMLPAYRGEYLTLQWFYERLSQTDQSVLSSLKSSSMIKDEDVAQVASRFGGARGD